METQPQHQTSWSSCLLESQYQRNSLSSTSCFDNANAAKSTSLISPLSREEALVHLTERTQYPIMQENGQRRYGPPPDWGLPAPSRGCEIFIGKIPRDCFEDELVPVFERIGKIYMFRLMMDFSGSNRGYGFCVYTTREDTRRAVTELDNYEIRKNRRIGVCLSIDNCRLFVGGIQKDKTKQEIMDEMCKVTDGVKDVIVYTKVQDKSKNRGFAFVEYENHKAAAMARRKLVPGRILLWGHQIAVDWAEPEREVDEDTMSKVRVLYVRNLMLHTTEQTLRDHFLGAMAKYRLHKSCIQSVVANRSWTPAVIERVKKMRDYAFVHFTERKHACIALRLVNGTLVDGARIEVTWAKPADRLQINANNGYGSNQSLFEKYTASCQSIQGQPITASHPIGQSPSRLNGAANNPMLLQSIDYSQSMLNAAATGGYVNAYGEAPLIDTSATQNAYFNKANSAMMLQKYTPELQKYSQHHAQLMGNSLLQQKAQQFSQHHRCAAPTTTLQPTPKASMQPLMYANLRRAQAQPIQKLEQVTACGDFIAAPYGIQKAAGMGPGNAQNHTGTNGTLETKPNFHYQTVEPTSGACVPALVPEGSCYANELSQYYGKNVIELLNFLCQKLELGKCETSTYSQLINNDTSGVPSVYYTVTITLTGIGKWFRNQVLMASKNDALMNAAELALQYLLPLAGNCQNNQKNKSSNPDNNTISDEIDNNFDTNHEGKIMKSTNSINPNYNGFIDSFNQMIIKN